MRKFLLITLGIIVVGGILFFTAERGGEDNKNTVTIKGYKLEVEIVRTPEEQMRGLSGRESLAENAGMLFVYEQQTTPAFWMKEMNFPIDIIWIGSDKRIVDITENLAPETFPQLFRPSAPVQYVLEVNAGWAENHTISTGDKIILGRGE